MGPKIFISSTFYDLKFVREDIADFVKGYRFEAILFENGDIGYVPGKPLDESCYHNISKSDMVILIIGGMYGSPATDETEDDFKEYMSVTRKEFQAAKDAEIPIYVFILSEVDAEYWVYQKNYDCIENQKKEIKFNTTKSINVFRFIMAVRSYPNVVINTFRKTSDIKEYLAAQWAGHFLHYLELIRNDKKNIKIENTLVTLQNKLSQVNLMVDEVGKKLLGKSSVKNYDEVKIDQVICDIKNIIVTSFKYLPLFDTWDEQCIFISSFVKKLAEMMEDKTFYLYMAEDAEDIDKFVDMFKFENAVIEYIKPGVEMELNDFIKEMKDVSIQQKLVEKILSDKKFSPIDKV